MGGLSSLFDGGMSELTDLSFLAFGIAEEACFISDSLRVRLELRLGEAGDKIKINSVSSICQLSVSQFWQSHRGGP